MAGEADETIITRFLVETSEAIKNAEEFRIAVNQIKEQLRITAKEAKENLSLVSKAMIEAFKSDRLKQAKDEIAQTLDVKGVIQRATADIQTYRSAMTQAIKEVRQEQTQQVKETQQQVMAMKSLDSQTQQSSQGFRIFGQEIRSVGDLAKVLFVSVLGITAIQTLRNIINWFKQAAQSGYELVKSMYQLSVGINVLRRTGVEITLQDMYENLDRLGKRFGIFSQKELIQGSSALVNLIRDFGFTKDQIFKMQEAIATLAVVNGRAMDEVQRTVALALSSGYTEGLQRLGVSINRVTIAQEAGRLGYAKNYMALTEVQRAEATYNLILQKTAKYQDDLSRYQETSAGKIDTLKSRWTDLVSYIGLAVIPAMADISEGFSDWIDKINEYYKTLVKIREEGVVPKEPPSVMARGREVTPFEWARPPEEHIPSQVEAELAGKRIIRIPAWLPDWLQWLFENKDEIQRVRDDLIEMFPPEMVDVADISMEKIQNIVSDSLEDLENFEEEYDNKTEDLRLDHTRDMDKIEREGARRMEELKIDHFAKLDQLELDYQRDVLEANTKYALDVAQAERQSALRKAEMQARYRENEKKAEIAFQEDLRRLREGFLLDLEDALHERDARQVLRLIRQYNLQKNQVTRQYEIEKDERARAHKLELGELEKQRQERLRILAEEHAARLAAMARQFQAEQDLEAARWKAQQEELGRRIQAQKDERELLLTQQIDDLETERDRLLTEIGEKLWGTLQELTDTGLKTLYDALVAVLGEEGAEKVFRGYASAAQQASADVNAAISDSIAKFSALWKLLASFANLGRGGGGGASSGGRGGGIGGGAPTAPGKPRQMGGSVTAGKSYSIAEKEIEVFTRPGTFVPDVSGQVYNQNQFLDLLNRQTSKSPSTGRVMIDVSLSPELIGEVIDNSLGQVADVVFELERRRR